MQDGDAALFVGAQAVVRSHDVDYPFRQNSDFWYLTGLAEPQALLLLVKGVQGWPQEILFVLPKDPAEEVWHGRRLGPERAVETIRVEAAYSVEDLDSTLSKVLGQVRRLWFRQGEHSDVDALVQEILSDLRVKQRRGARAPEALLDPLPLLHEMRLFKSEEEVDLMRKAAAITAEAHMLAMAQCGPGIGEWEIDATLQYTFRRHAAWGWAYLPIVAGGANACILHYTENSDALRDGDLVLVDAGAEYQGYAADVTRTYPVNGTFTGLQKEIYEIVLRAQTAAIEACRPGEPYFAPHHSALEHLCRGLIDLGVLNEDLESVLENRSYRPWFMHNTSHWLGLDVHDAGTYLVGGEPRPLQAGMCLTIEPGLYFSPDDVGIPKELRGIGVRIEDDVRITAGGHEVLTVATPRLPQDVEAACEATRIQPPTLDSALLASADK